MPTATWDRLAATRRDAVLNAAEAEFAENGFSRGSLNVIARNAGVAKGSLFQYFDDKVDLFGHLVDRAATRIGSAMDQCSDTLDWSSGFFPAFATLLDAWMDYFQVNPHDRALTVRASLELDPVTREAVTNAVDRRHIASLRPRLEAARDQGWLRADADLDAFLSFALLMMPHLAMEPELRTVSPVFSTDDGSNGRTGAHRLIAALEVAFGG
ncbi:MAG: TetR/AcrR family transcriptional regulator [Ilumatobacteraceae bacterium]